jgi:hypothetical protein
MRTGTINAVLVGGTLPAAALLVAASVALAQQQPAGDSKLQPTAGKETEPARKDREPTLEDLLAQALKDNPDIRVAEAKLHEADAELDRTRLQVMQKIVTLHADLQRARAKVASAESQFKRCQQLHERKAIDEAVLDEAQNSLAAAKADLASLETQLPALLGKPPRKAEAETARQDYEAAVSAGLRYLSRTQTDQQMTALGLLGLAAAQQAALVPVAEKVRKALDTPITVDFKDVPFAEVLENLQDHACIAIRDQLTRHYTDGNPKVTLKFTQPLPLRAVLQALQDEIDDVKRPGLRFVVREYGLLAVPGDYVPPGAVLVDRLGEGQPAHASDKNPPAENVEGQVTKVDAKTGLVTLSVGSDAGLATGHTLEVFRLNPAKYLGTVRVLEAKPREAVAQPVGRLLAPVQQGDKVANKIQGN